MTDAAPADIAPRLKSKLYLSAVAEARRMLGKRIKPENVVEHLLHDNRFHVLFPSHDGRSIGEDCRACAEEIVGSAVALRALKAAPLATRAAAARCTIAPPSARTPDRRARARPLRVPVTIKVM